MLPLVQFHTDEPFSFSLPNAFSSEADPLDQDKLSFAARVWDADADRANDAALPPWIRFNEKGKRFVGLCDASTFKAQFLTLNRATHLLNESAHAVESYRQEYSLWVVVYVSDGYSLNFAVQQIRFFNNFPYQFRGINRGEQGADAPIRVQTSQVSEFFIQRGTFRDEDPRDHLTYAVEQ